MDRQPSQSNTDHTRINPYNEASQRTKQNDQKKMIQRHREEILRLAERTGSSEEQAKETLKDKHNSEWVAYIEAVKNQQKRDAARMGIGYE